MKITLEQTDCIVAVVSRSGEVPGRIWEGQTESGIRVLCVITRIAVPEGENQEQFERELEACAPSAFSLAFPLRMGVVD